MSDIKISVIIPVYNTEKYLQQCIESVICQTLKEIEVIIINDGSTDNSLDIIEKYARIDKRIRVISKKNEGQAVARNLAVMEAVGEYLAFVDSDDWIDPDMFRSMYFHACRNSLADLVLCGFRLFHEGANYFSVPNWAKLPLGVEFEAISFGFEKVKSRIFLINAGPFNKIYKRDFIRKIKATFLEGYFYEDIIFVFRALLNADNICYLEKDYYTYRYLRPGSASAETGPRQFDIFIVLEKLRETLAEDGILEKVNDNFELYVFNTYLNHFNDISLIHKYSFWNSIRKKYATLDLAVKQKLLKNQKMLMIGVRLGYPAILIVNYFYHLWVKFAETKKVNGKKR